jgi:hypothetical protein
MSVHVRNYWLEDDMQNTALKFPLECRGKTLLTVDDASAFVLNLPSKTLDTQHWRAAYAAFSCASMEPTYLNAAINALELALTLDALIDPTLVPATNPSVIAQSPEPH